MKTRCFDTLTSSLPTILWLVNSVRLKEDAANNNFIKTYSLNQRG